MKIGKATAGAGATYAKNSSDDAIQGLEQRKQQLMQELKRAKESKKDGKAQQGEAGKRAKELNDQMQNIDRQIAMLRSQKQTASDQTQKVMQVLETNELDKGADSEDALTVSPRNQRFGERGKSGDESDTLGVTYRVASENGKRVVKCGKANTGNNRYREL